MKILLLLFPLPFLLPFLLGTTSAPPADSPPVQDSQEPGQEEEVGPLEERMLVLKRGMRALRRGLKDPKKDATSLEIVAGMAVAVGEGKLLTPPMLEGIPQEKKEGFLLEYRKSMVSMQMELLKLELALLGGDRDAAKAAYEALKDMEDAGHERFTEDG